MHWKRLRPAAPANVNDIALASVEGPSLSDTRLRASLVVPRDLVTPLPEPVIEQLHEEIDVSGDVSLHSSIRQLADFENAVASRLFPVRDQRRNVVRLRLHSHATAIASAVIAERLGLPKQAAYVCGWLHDMGIASCFVHLDDLSEVFAVDLHEQAWPTIRRSAPRHAIHLASRWRLPSGIRHSLRDHVGFSTTTAPSELACVSFVAEHVASAQGCGFWDEQPPVGLLQALERLQLEKRDLAGLERRTEELLGLVQLEWHGLAMTYRA